MVVVDGCIAMAFVRKILDGFAYFGFGGDTGELMYDLIDTCAFLQIMVLFNDFHDLSVKAGAFVSLIDMHARATTLTRGAL